MVRGADHGMSMNPKGAVEKVREYIGTAAVRWVNAEERKDGRTECVVRWDSDRKEVVDEGWKGAASVESSGPVLKGKEKEKKVRSGEGETVEKAPPSKRRKKALTEHPRGE